MRRAGHRYRALVGLAGLAVVLMLPMLAGCQEPLFSDRVPRSQYERYDSLRGEAAPRYEFQRQRGPGPRRPALRERLAPPQGY